MNCVHAIARPPEGAAAIDGSSAAAAAPETVRGDANASPSVRRHLHRGALVEKLVNAICRRAGAVKGDVWICQRRVLDRQRVDRQRCAEDAVCDLQLRCAGLGVGDDPRDRYAPVGADRDRGIRRVVLGV